jgi:ubiquinone/menaquinone biosynthesis C-methylase UbiE
MSGSDAYLMENSEEARRLDVKTDPDAVRRQVEICGMGPGARVLDGGCGSGKTTSIIHEIVQPGGSVIGVDFARERVDFAIKHYGNKDGIEFRCMDLMKPLDELGTFDFIWIRFVLEYYLEGSLDIIRNASRYLKPHGRLCLLDLDYNCLSHYPMKAEMEAILQKLVLKMMTTYNFDAFIGRKMYTYLYDLGFRDIEVSLIPHHLIYGNLQSSDDFNWIKKVEMASVKAKTLFDDYPGGYDGFLEDFNEFFHDPRRFTYTPLIICTGRKPEV